MPLIPGFGDFDDWNANNSGHGSDLYDPEELDNNYNQGGGYQSGPGDQWNTPPPPPMPPSMPYNMNSQQRWQGGGGLLPTPPSPLMPPRFMMGGNRPPFNPRNGPNWKNGNGQNYHSPGGFRGRGGRGSPYFRGNRGGGNYGGRGRGRW